MNIDPKDIDPEKLGIQIPVGMRVESIQVTPGKEPETLEEWKLEAEELKVLLLQSNHNFKLVKEHLIASRAQANIYKEALMEVDPENDLFPDYDDEDEDE